MRISFAFVALLALLGLAGGQALAASGAPLPKTVTVAMRDPGCHWFAVGGKLLKTLTVQGPVKLANNDEAALLVKSRAGVRRAPVGAKLALGRGVYEITMVGQAPDDNHLKLTIR